MIYTNRNSHISNLLRFNSAQIDIGSTKFLYPINNYSQLHRYYMYYDNDCKIFKSRNHYFFQSTTIGLLGCKND